MKVTSKKTKIIGTQQYINSTTGEVEEFQVIKLEERDFNFHKVWLEHIINSIDLIGNQKTKLAFWLMDNLKSENFIAMTYRQISQKSGISLETVQATMKVLIESNFLKRINNGCYQVNPEVLFKGTHHGRMKVLYDYQCVGEQLTLNDYEEPETPKQANNKIGTITGTEEVPNEYIARTN